MSIAVSPAASAAPSARSDTPTEQRRSARRALLCEVCRVTGTTARVRAASAIGTDGAFLICEEPPEIGARFGFTFVLPLRPPATIDVDAVVVRRTQTGVGVRFTTISSRNRALLIEYTSHILADDAVKRLQREFGDVVRGTLVPAPLRDEALDALEAAARERAEAKLILGARRFHLVEARLSGIHGNRLSLEPTPSTTVPAPFSPAYVTFSRREVQYVFETVVLEPAGPELAVQVPDRIYSTERRARPRKSAPGATAHIDVPYAAGGGVVARVLDYDAGGFAIALPAGGLVLPGTRVPRCRLVEDGRVVAEGEATIRNVFPLGAHEIRAGFEFVRPVAERRSFDVRERRPLRRSLLDSARLFGWALRKRIAALLGRIPRLDEGHKIEVVRYRNPDREEIVGLIDRTPGATSPVDLAVVIAPAGAKRKETLGLLARTIVDNFQAVGRSAVVLRFDGIRAVGESANDPGCAEDGRPMLHYTLSQVGRDIDTSIRFIKKAVNPRRIVLVSVSFSAVPSRAFLARGKLPPIDAWVSLYGPADAGNVMIHLANGEDVCAAYRRGERGPRIFVGHQGLLEYLVRDAIEERLETLEDAIEDMGRIQVPVTWVVGAHDYWVPGERIRRLLNAPGGGVREVFEVPTGHLVRTGEEALETFKLVTESIAKHALDLPLNARDPDMAVAEARMKAETDRVRRARPDDARRYWKEHLFGASGGEEGYDILRTSGIYTRFLEQQHDIAEIFPGAHVADLGCGTGNFAELAVARAIAAGARLAISCHDVVPEAVERTREKIEARLGAAAPGVRALISYHCAPLDLEVSRLKPVHDFLSGVSHGIEALEGRIEGLPEGLPARLRRHYSPELHAILRGRQATVAQVRTLFPEASDDDVEAVLDLSQAARFLLGTNGTGLGQLARLRFPGAEGRSLRTDLPDAAFDRIVSSLVISYLYQPAETLGEYFRALKPGGTVVISSLKPNFDFSEAQVELIERIKSLPADRLPPGETRESMLAGLAAFSKFLALALELEEHGAFRFFDGSTLRALLQDAGFEEIRIFEGFGDPGQAVVARATRPRA